MRLSPTGGNDRVYTPKSLAERCVNWCKLRDTDNVLEPASGEGVFVEVLHEYTHQIETCEIDQGRDFMDYSGKVDWVITNPPWSKYRQFVIKAMEVSDNIGFLIPLTNIVTKARLRDLRQRGFWVTDIYPVPTPKEFPQSGFQLVFAIIKKTSTTETKFHFQEGV